MFAGASLDENSGAFCELKANFFRLILTKAELLALNPKDVDLEKRTISITKSYQRLGKKDVITPPKTSKSKRVITIPEFLAADIKDYMDSLYDLQEDDRLFPITKYYLEHEMQRGIKESGVKRIRVHDLRHSHASMLIELGFSPLEIANRLGHEKVRARPQWCCRLLQS